VADGDGQRVGGVRRVRAFEQAEQPGHHGDDLLLVRPAGTGDGGLDLARGVEHDRQVPARGEQRDHPAGLGGAHRGADVVLAEHPLDRHHVRLVVVQPAFHLVGQPQQADRQVVLGRRAHHADRDRPHAAPGPPVHHAEAAPGEPRVDAEHPHRPTSSRPRTSVRA
jgi:hypothetical protein